MCSSCRVTAEVKHNPTNVVVCRVQGEWNGVLEFSFTNGETRVVDVTRLPVTRKNVRPIEKQGPTESRSEEVLRSGVAAAREGEHCSVCVFDAAS